MNERLIGASPSTLVLTDVEAVARYLDKHVGVGLEALDRCRQAGLADAMLTTDHSAKAAFGFRLWDGATRQLRDELAVKGWTAERPDGLEVVRRGDNLVQITASLGNEETGDSSPGASPTPKHPKGFATKLAVDANTRVPSFADEAPDFPALRPIATWWLLYRPVGLNEGELAAELSLPVDMAGSRITEWSVRLILPTSAEPTVRQMMLPEPAPEVNVAARRKAR